MSNLETLSTSRAHGGAQGVYRHQSAATGTPMTFSVFVPEHVSGERLPVLWYLSGLTCTPATATATSTSTSTSPGISTNAIQRIN